MAGDEMGHVSVAEGSLVPRDPLLTWTALNRAATSDGRAILLGNGSQAPSCCGESHPLTAFPAFPRPWQVLQAEAACPVGPGGEQAVPPAGGP